MLTESYLHAKIGKNVMSQSCENSVTNGWKVEQTDKTDFIVVTGSAGGLTSNVITMVRHQTSFTKMKIFPK